MALLLRDNGYQAFALEGGYRAWRIAGYPTEPKSVQLDREPSDLCPECGRSWNEHVTTV